MSSESTPSQSTISANPPSTSDAPPHRYTAALADEIELRWQDFWAREGTFDAPNPTGLLQPDPASPQAKIATRPKQFVLDMFPYPSGAGLHVGHPLGYIGTDAFARFKRMTGFNVLHSLGYDAFGLPAEQYAIQTGQHPRVTTEHNIATMRRQLRRLGLGHDPRRSVATTDPAYYRWTQWIFLQLFHAWFDDERKAARPISELEAEFAAGTRATPAGQPWQALTETARRSIIDDHRLAYLADAPVNWCPGLGTVLSNEEVTADGRSERGNFPVFKRTLRQWMLRITAYADRLLDDLDLLDWPEPIKLMQRNWIGRSTGAWVHFPIEANTDAARAAGAITVFTTRQDTIFGCNALLLAPEHPLVDTVTAPAWPADTNPIWTDGAATPAAAITAYRKQVATKTETERTATDKSKTGVFVGSHATNPVTGQPVPIFITDYVLTNYGTGAVMAVPGEDDRDWAFAEAYQLPIIRTVQPPADFAGGPYAGVGPMINSSNASVDLNGLSIPEAKQRVTTWLIEHGHGTEAVTYRLRDWLFSRQRYWGEPFPIVHDEHGPVAVPASMLPVVLPEIADYAPQVLDPNDASSEPEPPLGRAADWAEVTLDLGDGPKQYRRELNVMPNWAGSCWYELRYLDPTNAERFVDPDVERYWMGPQATPPNHPGGVDLYVGGVEHAVLHLLYARFWHKVLFDLGYVSSKEPYYRLFNQGYIQAYAYVDARGSYVPATEVTESPDGFSWRGEPVTQEYGKMGKSLKNIVTPDEMCAQYGADTFRVYEMSMGPLEASRPWETRAVIGSQRFLQRLWRTVVDEETGAPRVVDEPAPLATRQLLHRTIDGVRVDMAGLRFNTAVAKLIELVNHVTQQCPAGAPREIAEGMALMLAPVAPHIAEELWRRLGHSESLAFAQFPTADPALLVAETVEYPVQVNGKVRARVVVAADADADAVQAAALADEKVAALLTDAEIAKVLVVPGRIVTVATR